MRKTLEVAELLYFQPVGLAHGSSADFSFVPVDVESHYVQVNSVDSTVAALRRKDADHWRHMMSGRGMFHFLLWGLLTDSPVDLESNDNDLDLLREIEESNNGELPNQISCPLADHFFSRLESRSIR